MLYDDNFRFFLSNEGSINEILLQIPQEYFSIALPSVLFFSFFRNELEIPFNFF